MIKVRLPAINTKKSLDYFLDAIKINREIITIFWFREIYETIYTWAAELVLSEEFPELIVSISDMFYDLFFSYDLNLVEYLHHNKKINEPWIYEGYNAVVKKMLDGEFDKLLMYDDLLKAIRGKKQTLKFDINHNPLAIRGIKSGYITFCMGDFTESTKFFLGVLLFALFHKN